MVFICMPQRMDKGFHPHVNFKTYCWMYLGSQVLTSGQNWKATFNKNRVTKLLTPDMESNHFFLDLMNLVPKTWKSWNLLPVPVPVNLVPGLATRISRFNHADADAHFRVTILVWVGWCYLMFVAPIGKTLVSYSKLHLIFLLLICFASDCHLGIANAGSEGFNVILIFYACFWFEIRPRF